MINIGIIGCGLNMQRNHVPTFMELEKLELIKVKKAADVNKNYLQILKNAFE